MDVGPWYGPMSQEHAPKGARMLPRRWTVAGGITLYKNYNGNDPNRKRQYSENRYLSWYHRHAWRYCNRAAQIKVKKMLARRR